MARPKLSNQNQPLHTRAILRLYEFLASLKLAVLLIFSVAVVLAVATFVESNWGTAAAKWYIYHSKWYLLLMGMLALNIFCAAAIRYPWKRHQTGFVITHIGLLTLLAGSAVSFRGSLNSQMLVYLNGSGQVAVDQDEGFLVFDNLPGHPGPLRHRFHSGPFHWSDLAPYGWQRQIKSWVGLDDASKPWVHPPTLIYDKDDVRVEIVDYFSKSELRELPYLRLMFHNPAFNAEMPIELEYNSQMLSGESDFGGLGRVVMWRTDRADDMQAFPLCAPERSVDGDGAIIIVSEGERHHLPIGMLKQRKEKNEPYQLNDHTTVELIAYVPWADVNQLVRGQGLVSKGDEPVMPAVELLVKETVGDDVREHRIARFAEFPYMPYRSRPDQFLAEFYHPSMRGRVDILEGPQQQLAYRVWQQKLGMVASAGELRPDVPVETWSTGGRTEDGPPMIWMMTLDQYVPPADDDETYRVLPLPFEKDNRGESKRIKLRVTSKDIASGEPTVDEFWLRQNMPPPWQSPDRAQVHQTLAGGPPIRSSYHVKETDVGCAFKLVEFDLDVDPGTTMAMNYTSHILLVDVRNKPEIAELRENLDKTSDPFEKQQVREAIAARTTELTDDYLAEFSNMDSAARAELVTSDSALSTRVITMNEPLDYPDWSGRTLRFFQENYLKPEPELRSPLGSIFRVNYDPGRWIKYLGSLLITSGIFTMFYMRAYFFKAVKQPVPARATVAATVAASERTAVGASAQVPTRRGARQ